MQPRGAVSILAAASGDLTGDLHERGIAFTSGSGENSDRHRMFFLLSRARSQSMRPHRLGQ